MNKKLLALKIKIKSLAAEARIIRDEERKLTKLNRRLGNLDYNKNFDKINDAREYLYAHRIQIVKYEIRAAGLAYAFIRGKNYKDIEHKSHKGWMCVFHRVKDIVSKFQGSKVDPKELLSWFEKPSQLEVPLTYEKVVVEKETV